MKKLEIIGNCRKKIIERRPDGLLKIIDKKETQAINFIRSVAKQIGVPFVAYSGGKDSEVLLHLMKLSGVEFTAYYNNTTIDPPGTLAWIKQHSEVMIMQPAKTFYQLIEHRGLPNFNRRFCCEKLKERYVANNVFSGVRQAESEHRKNKYKENEICITYKHGQKARHYTPILSWTNEEVQAYIISREIKCHPNYYDEEGNFHVERRLGCLGCPLANDKNIGHFEKYPKMVRAWCRALAVYRLTRNKPEHGVYYFKDEYEQFYSHMFCRTIEDLQIKRMVNENWRPRILLEERFKIKLPEPMSVIENVKTK